MWSFIFKKLMPKNAEQAALYKRRLALIYAIIGSNAFVYAFYLFTKDELPLDPDQQKTMLVNELSKKGKNIEIIRLQGLQFSKSSINNDPNNANT